MKAIVWSKPNCGYCVTDDTEADEVILRDWDVPSDQSEYWNSTTTNTALLFNKATDAQGIEHYPDRKYIWGGFVASGPETLDYGWENGGASQGTVPTIGDVLNTYNGLYHVKCRNRLVIKGGPPVASGPTVTIFKAYYGEGHEDSAFEILGSENYEDPTGKEVNLENGLSEHTIYSESSGLGDGNITFTFDACEFPFEGKYKIKYSVYCADTGLFQFEKEIDIYVDKAKPFSLNQSVVDEDMIQSDLMTILEEGSNRLTYNFTVSDNKGVACAIVQPARLYPAEMDDEFCVPGDTYNCDKFYVMFGGDLKNGEEPTTEIVQYDEVDGVEMTASVVQIEDGARRMNVQRTRILTDEELNTCVCNGTHRLNVLAIDYAGNCHFYHYLARVHGSTRGQKAGGLCRPLPVSNTNLALGWKNSDGYFYSERLCCLESGGYYDSNSQTCIEFGDKDYTTGNVTGTCTDASFNDKNACLCGTDGIWDPTTGTCIEGSILEQGTCSDPTHTDKANCFALGSCSDPSIGGGIEGCCTGSGGTWDEETATCIGGSESWTPSNTWTPFAWTYGEQWEWNTGLCVDCYGNPIGDPSEGVGVGSNWDDGTGTGNFFYHTNEQSCVTATDPVCDCQQMEWWHGNDGDADTEGTTCSEMFTDNIIDVPVGGLISPNSGQYGWSVKLNLSNFLRKHGCWGDGDCSEWESPGWPNEPDGGWNYEFLAGANVNIGCFPSDAFNADITSPYVENGQVYIGIDVSVIDWAQFNRLCGIMTGCALTLTVPQLLTGCCTDKAAGTGNIFFHVPLNLEGQCCECCNVSFNQDLEDLPLTGMTTNAALQYNIVDDRWDVSSIGDERLNESLDMRVGGATIGKFGEQVIYQGGELKGLNKNTKETKPWIYHSKDYTMGIDSQYKRFKSVKIRANHKFNADVYEETPEDSSVQPITNEGVFILVDGLYVPAKRVDDIDDMDAAMASISGEEKQFHVYEYEIDRKYQKGTSVAIRMQNQTDNSIVESFSFVYRIKPVK